MKKTASLKEENRILTEERDAAVAALAEAEAHIRLLHDMLASADEETAVLKETISDLRATILALTDAFLSRHLERGRKG